MSDCEMCLVEIIGTFLDILGPGMQCFVNLCCICVAYFFSSFSPNFFYALIFFFRGFLGCGVMLL